MNPEVTTPDVQIGAPPVSASPSRECPYCHATELRKLGLADFPEDARNEVAQAMLAGAVLIECGACAKRYAVQPPRPRQMFNRHERRRREAEARQLARRSARFAKRTGVA